MPSPARPSLARLIAGIIILLAAVVMALTGFLRLFAALEAQGHGSVAVRHALIWLAVAGGGLGAGICLLIWEFSVRLSRSTGAGGADR